MSPLWVTVMAFNRNLGACSRVQRMHIRPVSMLTPVLCTTWERHIHFPSQPHAATMSIANATEPLVTHTQDMTILWLERTEFVGSILGGVGYGSSMQLAAMA
jgi:hypothetical protein